MGRINKDDLEVYFLYGIDIKNRCIFLNDEIDNESAGYVIKGLYLMEHQNDKYEPIELRISSCGGDIYDMFAVHDITRTLHSPVHTMGMGTIMSAAVLLVACGEKGERWAGANTSFMVHEPWSNWGEKKISDVGYDLNHVKKLWDNWYLLMEKYTKMPKSHWKKLCSKNGDAFFTTEQALDWGVIDNIWSEKD